MTSDTVFTHENDKNLRPTTRHFEVVQSEEDDEENQIKIDEETISATITPDPIETFEDEELNKLYNDWLALDGELRNFEPDHKEYVRKLDEVEKLKAKYRSEFDKYKKKLVQLQKDVKQLKKKYNKKGR